MFDAICNIKFSIPQQIQTSAYCLLDILTMSSNSFSITTPCLGKDASSISYITFDKFKCTVVIFGKRDCKSNARLYQ